MAGATARPNSAAGCMECAAFASDLAVEGVASLQAHIEVVYQSVPGYFTCKV